MGFLNLGDLVRGGFRGEGAFLRGLLLNFNKVLFFFGDHAFFMRRGLFNLFSQGVGAFSGVEVFRGRGFKGEYGTAKGILPSD